MHVSNRNGRTGCGIGRVIGAVLFAAGLVSGTWLTPHAAAQTLSYNGTNIQERWQNDGGFNPAQNFITVTLAAAHFTNLPVNTDFIAGGQVTAQNVPYGLTPVATRTATNKVTLSLTGFASTNGASATTNGLRFVFNNGAFSNLAASSVSGSGGTNLTVLFLPTFTNWYVNGSAGSDANNGLTPATPFKTISKAHSVAQSGANDIIHIAAGFYYQSAALAVTKSVTFQGDDPATTVLQPQAGVSSLFTYSSTVNTMYQNLTLQNCTGVAINQGGNNAAGDLVASNCWFFNNSTPNCGAAVYNFCNGTFTGNWGLRFYSCLFTNNSANYGSGYGGGAICSYNMPIWIYNCTFIGNTSATNGGAIWTYAANVAMANSSFLGNTARQGSGGVYANSATTPFVYADHCLFASNSAYVGGGALSTWGLVVTNSTFYGNTAATGLGGAVSATHNQNAPVFYNCTLVNNSAATGGAMRCFQGPTVVSSLIASNTALVAPDIYVYGSGSLTASKSLVSTVSGTTINSSTAFGLPNASGNYCGTNGNVAQAGVLPLANNGGLYPSCALAAGSVAIDSGTNPLAVATDVRGPGYARQVGAQVDMGAYESGNALLPDFVYSSPLFNGDAAGYIVTTNTITMVSQEGDTLSGVNGQDFVAAGWLTTANVPAGLTVVATRISDTTLRVTMTGAAASPTNVFTITFAFTSDAVVAPAGVSNNFANAGNQTVNDLAALFTAGTGTPTLLYGGAPLLESAVNNGSVTSSITITLTNALFVDWSANDYLALGRLQIANVPAGLTPHAVPQNPYAVPQVLTVWFTGSAAQHNSNNNANLIFTFGDGAFAGGSAAAVSNATYGVPLQFTNPTLTYFAKVFGESWRNDGSITNTITAGLVGDTFNGAVGADLYADGKVTVQNLPAGLTPVVTVQSATGLVIALAGNAASHTVAQSVNNLGFTFNTAAFTMSNPSSLVTNYNESDLSVAFLSQNAATWYVDGSRSDDTGDGLTLGTAFKTITNALKHVQSQANDVIYIAAGTYIQPQIAVANPVSLVGLGASPADTVIEPHPYPNAATNSAVFSLSTSALFANLTIQNGRAPQGGGISVVNNTVAELVVSNCVFANNSATNSNGGAICKSLNTNPFPAYAQLVAVATTFSNNTAARGNGGAAYVFYDGFFASNCVFVGNTAALNGGAVYLSAPAGGAPTGTVVNCQLLGNVATNQGGAVYLNSYRPFYLGNATLASNTSGSDGGGLCANTVQNLSVVNSTFFGNTSTNGSGGGLWYYSNSGVMQAALYNCTVSGNTATNGGGVRSYSTGGLKVYGSILASNTATAVANNSPDLYVVSGTAWATNSLIGITNGAGGDASMALGGPNAGSNYCGNAGAPRNPGLLPLADNGGAKVGPARVAWPTLTCGLQPDSAAIDHGINPLNLSYDQRGPGYARKTGTGVDMGAYEYGSRPPILGTVLYFQ